MCLLRLFALALIRFSDSESDDIYTIYASVLVIVDTCLDCLGDVHCVWLFQKTMYHSRFPAIVINTIFYLYIYVRFNCCRISSAFYQWVTRAQKIFWYFRPHFHHVPPTAVIFRGRPVYRTLPLYRGFFNIININNQFRYLITFIILNYQLVNVYTMCTHCTFLQFT